MPFAMTHGTFHPISILQIQKSENNSLTLKEVQIDQTGQEYSSFDQFKPSLLSMTAKPVEILRQQEPSKQDVDSEVEMWDELLPLANPALLSLPGLVGQTETPPLMQIPITHFDINLPNKTEKVSTPPDKR